VPSPAGHGDAGEGEEVEPVPKRLAAPFRVGLRSWRTPTAASRREGGVFDAI